MDRESYSGMYTFEICIALSSCVFLWNLEKLVRIKFGDQLLTHLSLLPYMTSLILLSVTIIELLWMSYLSNVLLNDNELLDLLNALYNPISVSYQFITPMELVKVSLI